MGGASIKSQLIAWQAGKQQGLLKTHITSLLVGCGYTEQAVSNLVATPGQVPEIVYYLRPGWPEWYFSVADDEVPVYYTTQIASVMLDVLKTEGMI
jgi:hypothetical protein